LAKALGQFGWNRENMNTNIILAAVLGFTALTPNPAIRLAQSTFDNPIMDLLMDHTDEAVSHLRQAVAHGKAGQWTAFREDAEVALKHIEVVAEEANSSAHTKKGIGLLKAAIFDAKRNHLEAALRAAEDALRELQHGDKAPA
jgi:hypothetical protein